jgi:hypothetical protein
MFVHRLEWKSGMEEVENLSLDSNSQEHRSVSDVDDGMIFGLASKWREFPHERVDMNLVKQYDHHHLK